MKISEVKEILAGEPDPDQVAELAADERSGVQKLVVAYHKRQEKLRLEQQRFTEMLAYERKYYDQGAQYIAGIDEAGRGPLAGPLVIAAVILPQEVFISGLMVLPVTRVMAAGSICRQLLSLELLSGIAAVMSPLKVCICLLLNMKVTGCFRRCQRSDGSAAKAGEKR